MKVINGIKKDRKPTLEMYRRILADLIEVYSVDPILDDRDGLKKFAYYVVQYVKLIKTDDMDSAELHSLFQLIDATTQFMGCMTPVEFIQTFPAEKQYDGHKYESKDYFTTMDSLKEYPPNKMIGEGIMKLLWDYHNWDIHRFESRKMCCISRIQRLNGEKDWFEQFFEDQGRPLTMYYEDGGRLVNSKTGEIIQTSKPKKRRPKYLSVVGD